MAHVLGLGRRRDLFILAVDSSLNTIEVVADLTG
jgi:hypothetical protein